MNSEASFEFVQRPDLRTGLPRNHSWDDWIDTQVPVSSTSWLQNNKEALQVSLTYVCHVADFKQCVQQTVASLLRVIEMV